MSTGKHVIFLGAGASHGSGYPLANGLRLLISSRRNWEKALLDYGNKLDPNHSGLRSLDLRMTDIGLPFWEKHIQALTLFRNGGFATLDEFCLLAGQQFQNEINGLRRLVRAALGLFNPEDHFEDSEYYAFIQALFKDDLISLREDLSVLTYNYDPYLEFLLHRALVHRTQIRGTGQPAYLIEKEDFAHKENYSKALGGATSGFGSSNNLTWLEEDKTQPSFCLLKLHGSICREVDTVAGYQTLFEAGPLKRAESLFGGLANDDTPPILFPWEIMTNQGFVGKDSILFQTFGSSVYELFRGIWERARREVQSADKVSFVGLSLHSLIHDGLKYLFEVKKKSFEVCLANRENTPFDRQRVVETHWNNLPNSPAAKLAKTIGKVAPGVSWSGRPLPKQRDPGDITLVSDFESFVRTQMKPIEI